MDQLDREDGIQLAVSCVNWFSKGLVSWLDGVLSRANHKGYQGCEKKISCVKPKETRVLVDYAVKRNCSDFVWKVICFCRGCSWIIPPPHSSPPPPQIWFHPVPDQLVKCSLPICNSDIMLQTGPGSHNSLLVKHQTHGWKVASSNSGRSGWRIFFSTILPLCYFSGS